MNFEVVWIAPQFFERGSKEEMVASFGLKSQCWFPGPVWRVSQGGLGAPGDRDPPPGEGVGCANAQRSLQASPVTSWGL